MSPGVNAAIAVMLKAPQAGSVKTRLVPPLTFDEAAGLYASFVKDIFKKTGGLDAADVYAVHAGPDALLAGLIPEGTGLIPQEGADLGERMLNCFKRLFDKGYERVVIIGSDSPDLPADYIKEALSLLGDKTVDAVLGPARDGGYYLIGMKEPLALLFEGMAWSTADVLRNTIARLADNHVDFRLLPPWHDIDAFVDLGLLNKTDAPMTAAFLVELSGKRPVKTSG